MPAPVTSHSRSHARRAARGFTLIELLVVVGIIALISGLLLPVFIQARERARKRVATSSALVQRQSPAPTTPDPPLPAGPAPVIDAVNLKLVLASSYHRIGMDVFTRYQLDCSGQVDFQPPAGSEPGPVTVTLPFPENILEARDVQLRVVRPGSTEALPLRDVHYTREGILFTCMAVPGQPLTADVSFTAFGRDQLDYALPPAQQLRSVSITLDLPGVPSRTIPDDSLQPSAEAPGQVRWEFKNLVSDRRIIVQIPAAQAPLARALVLTRLVAVAVLLFGAGFWFLSEQSRPGQLDRFRLGHFLLLALTYSLFFVIFAVLELDGKLRTAQSLAASAVFSVPLLVLHVSRVLNLRFAITRVIPLAIFTLALVLNGVYGGAYRDYAYIGATVFVIAYVTLVYESWSAGRAAYQWERDAAHAVQRAALIDQVTRKLGGRVTELSGADAQAEAYLKTLATESALNSEQQAGARARLERVREPVSGLVKEYEELVKRLSYVTSQTGWEAGEIIKSYQREVDSFAERLEPRIALLQSELAEWQPEPVPMGDLTESELHCAACGKVTPDAPFCPHCGSARPEATTCTGCGERIIIPLHLLAKEGRSAPLFCPRCGTRVAGARTGAP